MSAKLGYILINIGAPESAQKVDQERYLKEVSKDHHVTDLPSALDTAIHPHRADHAATAYKEIWHEEEPPLIDTCKKIRKALLKRRDAAIEIGMMYGTPSIKRGIGRLLDAQVDGISVIPMFPQYSTETFQNGIDRVHQELAKRRSRVPMRSVDPFYNAPVFINPLAKQLAAVDEHILFSYRGLSLHHLTKPDQHGHCLSSVTCCNEPSAVHDTCYRFQCLQTTRLIAKAAGLSESQYTIAFDSHHGPLKCIEPYTEDVLRKLPAQNHRRLTVICPSHLCDSMETLEEIGIRGKDIFLNAGGESFRMIPGMNDSEEGIQCLESVMHT